MMNSNNVRRSQLISPWGVGAIVPFPRDESLMIAGLDMWRFGDGDACPDSFLIHDERLARRLGVAQLRMPPDYRERDTHVQYPNLTIPAVRFPLWHYCPNCGTMEKLTYFETDKYCKGYEWGKGRSCFGKKRKPKLIPERFIVICEDGHVADFPVAEWLHHGAEHPYDEKTCTIKRTTGGVSASLTSVRYICSCGASKSMASATRKGALDKIGITCRGSMPWLGVERNEHHPCGKSLLVVQRGGSNVWFPVVKSSIFIPIEMQGMNARLSEVLERHWSRISSSLDGNGELERDKVNMVAFVGNVDADELFEAAMMKLKQAKRPVNEETSEEEYRMAEYAALQKSFGGDELEFYNRNKDIKDYHQSMHQYFRSISLVHRLRETRAFTGFTRLLPDYNKPISELKKQLSRNHISWLPAVQVFGEGIFFEFDKHRLNQWAALPGVKGRAAYLSKSHNQSTEKRGVPPVKINPEYVLLHTFAHVLINRLSYECGYGSSSIRERIYCDLSGSEHNMFGVLIYTASGDAEGSMGGLVRMGKPGYLEDVILNAIEKARWCSADPLCIESEGQGPESCNLAACHNCALLPETSCENGNRILDRAMLIGNADDISLGYFNIHEKAMPTF